tara:strand:+ start:740 stop:1012 length:273 start_codon:yes stop_codon:yes gene_type:complete
MRKILCPPTWKVVQILRIKLKSTRGYSIIFSIISLVIIAVSYPNAIFLGPKSSQNKEVITEPVKIGNYKTKLLIFIWGRFIIRNIFFGTS